MITFDENGVPVNLSEHYYTLKGEPLTPEQVAARQHYDDLMQNTDVAHYGLTEPEKAYAFTPQQLLYHQVASGITKLDPKDFDSLFSDEDLAMSSFEFSKLPASIQAEARKNPQLFMQSVLDNTANKDHGDLLSLGAEGGFSDYDTAKWTTGGLTPDQSKYMQIHEEPDWGLYAMLALMGGAVGAANGLFGGAVGGTGAVGTAGVTAADFALADAAQLAAQGLTQSEIASVMAAGGIEGTGGFLVGTGGLTGTTGNAMYDAILNGAARGGIVSGITTGDPLSGITMGGISGGFGQMLPDFGSPIVNGAARGIPSAVISGSPTPLVTGGVGGGLSQVGNELELGRGGTSLLTNVGTGLVREAMRPDPVARAYRPQGPTPMGTIHPEYGRMIPRT